MIELAGIVILGILAQWLAWRLKVPAILPLLLIGLLFGPISQLITEDGSKWLDPTYNPINGKGLFAGQSLFYFVSLAIGIILFEGGLTLKRNEIREVAPAILKLISIGSIVSFIGGGLASHFLLGLSWQISFLFGALIIVTGPTVIAPILRNVPLSRNLSAVLKWEGILIDPIGALAAVLVYEFIMSGEGGAAFTMTALVTFGKILVTGFAVGFGAAYFLYFAIKKERVPHYLLNVFTLALVLGAFVLSDLLEHESGLLTVVVMGTVLGNMRIKGLKEILYFKESLTVLLISILFILLSANINIEQLLILDYRAILVFAIVVFLLRPMGVFLSTMGSQLSTNEKLFISWIGPRGIVAAGIASLFSIKLTQKGVNGADYITPLVFLIVLGTVLLNATTARLIARLLGVVLEKSDGILLVGADKTARMIAKFLQDNGRNVMLIDRSEENVRLSKRIGLRAISENIFEEELKEQYDMLDIGYLFAMTSNAEVNMLVCRRLRSEFGENGTFRLIGPQEMDLENIKDESLILFSKNADYINLTETARRFENFNTLKLKSTNHLHEIIKHMGDKHFPIFIKQKTGNIEVITSDYSRLKADDGDLLIYLGNPLEHANSLD